MASSDLDHLKINYRTRFCCTSRVPDTDLWQGQNILENIQDCFEEKSSDTGFSTNPGSPTLCSTPCKLNDPYSSPDKECQISPSNSEKISPVKKKANASAFSQQTITLQNQSNNISAPTSEIPQKLLQDIIGLKNTSNLKYPSSGTEEFNKIPNEVVEEFYLTVGSPGLLAKETEILPLPQQATPIIQLRRNRVFGNSVIQQPLLPKSSHKTKKSLNCEDAAVCSAVKKAEKDARVSEDRQKKKQSESSEQVTQNPTQKIQQKTETRFSTLLLETAKRNCRNSSVLRHVSSPQIRSPSPLPNNLEISNDEFIIDESDCSVSQDWILIPKKNSKSVKQSKTASVENSQDPGRKNSRIEKQQGEKCSLASDKYPDTENRISDVISGEKISQAIKHKARAVEKSQPSKRKKLDNLSGEMGDASKSTRHRIYSEKSDQFLENKSAVVQRQSEKCETQIDNRQSDESPVNFAEENQDSFHSEKDIAKVDTALKPIKSKTSSVEKSQSPERRKLRKRQKKDYKPKVGVEQHEMEQTKKKRLCLSQTNQDKLQKESDRSLGQQEERAECPSTEQILSASGKGKKNEASQQIRKKGHLNKTTSRKQQISKKEIISKQNETQKFTVTRSKRISRCPSNWWVVTTEESNTSYSPILELPVNEFKKLRPPNETKKIPSKTLEKETIPPQNQKALICAKLKGTNRNRPKRKKLTTRSNDENCDTALPVPKLNEQEDSLKETSRQKNVAFSSPAESPKECISDVPNGIQTPAMPASDSKTFVTSIMEESGPHRLRNVLTATDKIFEDEQECDKGGIAASEKLSNDKISCKEMSIRKAKKVYMKPCDDEQKKKAIAALNVPLGDPFKPTCVFDPGEEQMVFMDLVKLNGTHDFCVQDDTLKMFKILNTSLFATGTLILEPLKEKGNQYVCSDTVVFYVVSGDLICTLHETSYNLTTGDSFYVPSGNFYNIKNLLNERSILLFTQIKSERPEK